MAPNPALHASAASSIYQTVQQFASAVGIACYGIVFFGSLGGRTGSSEYTAAFAAVVPLVVPTAVVLILTSRLLSPEVLRSDAPRSSH
jgi:hypothetical protein